MNLTAQQLNGTHLGRTVTVHHHQGTYTGELDRVEHHRETESIGHYQTDTDKWVALCVGVAEIEHVPINTPVNMQAPVEQTPG